MRLPHACLRAGSIFVILLLVALTGPVIGQESRVPRWDARGSGPLPRQGITSIDISDDGAALAIGTIAAPGDPNVVVLDMSGKLVAQYEVGQRWIDSVAFVAGTHDVLAVCTMPEGKPGDRPEAFLLRAGAVEPTKVKDQHPPLFHYGDHSNHPTLQLARAPGVTAILAGNQVHWRPEASVQYRLGEADATTALAVGADGWVVVGTTAQKTSTTPNLIVFHPKQKQPVWSRPVERDVAAAPAPEKGEYGTPTLPDGRREELPQRDEKVWAPLSVAIHTNPGAATYRVAAADYQGWQRLVRSSATTLDDNQGLRFMPSRPTITVYDQDGKTVRRFAADVFAKAFWCDLRFSPDARRLLVWPHSWKSRGLAGQPLLPADDDARTLYALDLVDGKVHSLDFPDAISDIAIDRAGHLLAGCWNGEVYRLKDADLAMQRLPKGIALGGPSLLHLSKSSDHLIAATSLGVVHCLDREGKRLWQTDLNEAVPRKVKPWVARARALPIVPGVWQLPGGRVQSDLGGQRLIEAPDGYILIEAHSGLSFESEWASIEAVGLDPKKVKYVVATHEHGDHAPGAYLWRVVTGAQFICSREMAYTLQHHIPGNSGYGFHPPVPTDLRIEKDTDLDLAGLKVRAVRIPGHTYGSMAWHFEKSGKTFVAFGDLIMPRGVLGYSGSVNFSATDILSSLRKLRDLKPDYVLPGHGPVEGPGNYLQAGIDVGTAVGWGFVKPERPDPYFRITQKNVVAVGWNQQAVSGAVGDVNQDGRPDVVVVSRQDDGSVVKFFLNHGGRFSDAPDHEIRLPDVAQPHKVRVVSSSSGTHVFVAGKSAALLQPQGKFPDYRIVPLDAGDGNHLRFLNDGKAEIPVVSRRFGALRMVEPGKGRVQMRDVRPEVSGPYIDFRLVDLTGNGRMDLVSAGGDIYLRNADGTLPASPSQTLPTTKRDWTFLAVGDFNADGRPDVALLSYGMNQGTTARLFYNRGQRPFGDKEDATITLSSLLTEQKKGQTPSLVRDTPVVVDWNGDGIADLVVAHGQGNEVLVLLGGKEGLSPKNVRKIALDFAVHFEHGPFVADFNGDGKPDLAVFGYTNTGVGSSGPPAMYLWLQNE